MREMAVARWLIKPDGAPINILGGYRFPDAAALDPRIERLLMRAAEPISESAPPSDDGEYPDIPDFLRRAARAAA